MVRSKNGAIAHPRGSFLAVLGQQNELWFGRATQHVYEETKNFDLFWLEEHDMSQNQYQLAKKPYSCPKDSVILRVKFAPTGKGVYTIKPRTKQKAEEALAEALNPPENDNEDIDASDESDSGVGEDEESRAILGQPRKRKAKSSIQKGTRSKLKKTPSSLTKKGAKKNSSKPTGKAKKSGKVSTTKKQPGVKVPRPPNWKLKPNPNVKVWDKDPLFETREEVPFVSSSAHSKLVIRAILLRDHTLLKKCIEDTEHIHSLNMKRSLQNDATALTYALKMNDIFAVKLLVQAEKKERSKHRVDRQPCMMEQVGTGVYNYRSLGIRKIRALKMSRGGREGNNALTKDISDPYGTDLNNLSSLVMKMGLSQKMVNELIALDIYLTRNSVAWDSYRAISRGFVDVAAWAIERDVKANVMGSMYNHYHHEALVRDNTLWKGPIREMSARKKGPHGLTPLHCAVVNPNISALKQLFAVCPDVNVMDEDNRKLIHYAVACRGMEPIKFLVEHGANLEDLDKRGMTPLMRACQLGRPLMVQYIIDTLKKSKPDPNDINPIVKKMGVAGMDRPTRQSWSAINFAINEGHADVVQVLVRNGVNVDRQLNTNHDKITPMMQAAGLGHLEIVRLLAPVAKIEKPDRYKRTALTHAVMNGAADIASFLLSLGADPNRTDTSGNSNMHYACAYGWHFCTKVLIDAGAELNACNEWKLTPTAVALLKGHKGIAKPLLAMPGVDINFKDDKGRTVLLGILSALNVDQPLTQSLFNEIKDMVDRLGADPHAVDNDGLGAVHFLCKYNPRPNHSNMDQVKDVKKFEKLWKERIAIHKQAVLFFTKAKVNLFHQDERGYLPIMYAVEVPMNLLGRRYFDTISSLLEAMIKSSRSSKPKIELKKNQPSWLSVLVQNVSLPYIQEWIKMFRETFEILHQIEVSPSLGEMVNQDVPFLVLCQSYGVPFSTKVDSPFFSSFCSDLKADKSGTLAGQREYLKQFRQLIFEFMNKLKPEIEVNVPVKVVVNGVEKEKSCMKSALVNLALAQSEPDEDRFLAFREMEKQIKANVDILDEDGRTPFNLVVQEGRLAAAKLLEEFHCDIDHAYVSRVKCQVNNNESIFLKYCPILDATKNGDLPMVKFLIHVGADIHLTEAYVTEKDGEEHRESLFFLAVSNCMSDRRNKEKLGILKALIAAGVDVTYQHRTNLRNALHLAINSSSDNADQALDLELTLLRSNVDVMTKDIRERYPLHYAFVKIGAHTNHSRTDPIEVCSMIVEAMEDQNVDEADEYGTTPLHYAAYRGATVSCLLLISKGADVNRVDLLGNTALAYAVLGQHEGCALILLQKGANVHVNVHKLKTSLVSDHGKNTVEIEKALAEYSFRFNASEKRERSTFTLFEGLIQNSWLGITYMALEQLEKFGMSYARAIEIALFLQKIQFAKTLISKQVSVEKIREKNAKGRNLIHCMALECKHTSSKEIQEDVFEMLLDAQIDPFELDHQGSNALHYLGLNSNRSIISALMCQRPSEVKPMINLKNTLGITPIGALLWNHTKQTMDTCEILRMYLRHGANANLITQLKPLCHVSRGFKASFKNIEHFEDDNIPVETEETTPLIAAIIMNDRELVKLLLQEAKVDVSLTDSNGMTPLMHAVKTNNVDMLIQVLAQGETRHYDNPALRKKLIPNELDLTAIDKNDRTVFHHLLAVDHDSSFLVTFDNAEMLDVLLQASKISKRSVPSVIDHRFMSEAEKLGNRRILEALMKKVNYYPTKDFKSSFEPPRVADCVQWSSDFSFNLIEDSQAMLAILRKRNVPKHSKRAKTNDDDEDMSSEDESDSETDSDMDTNAIGDDNGQVEGVSRPQGLTIQNGSIHDGYAILMTKIDVSFGAWGLYNFYRMQIWKDKYKDLWVLFTNWGRIGDYRGGQYQNTPFGTADKAIEEFEKTFKAKTGNEWKDLNDFQQKPRKYRLVDVEKLKTVKKSALEFDLRSKIPSQLPPVVQSMIEDIANVSMYIEANKEIGNDPESLPFGSIKRDQVEKAKEILEQIRDLIADKVSIESKRTNNSSEALQERLFECVDEISKLSSEYFYLMPKKGFEFTKVLPIDNDNAMTWELNRVNLTLDLEAAERLLLGAQYRRNEINPLDYIYRSLGCVISPLNPHTDEATCILRYIGNSPMANTCEIDGIFKIKRDEEFSKFGHTINPKHDWNRRLLFHGSKPANLFSIFTHGLMANAPTAMITGRAYGEGIYTADVFSKSDAYTNDPRFILSGSSRANHKYMLLCDVALGKQFLYNYNQPIRKHYDSILVEGYSVPNPEQAMFLKSGLELPVGEIIRQSHMKGYASENREYVTLDDSQCSLRYIVKYKYMAGAVPQRNRSYRTNGKMMAFRNRY